VRATRGAADAPLDSPPVLEEGAELGRLPVGRSETGPSIAELVEAVRAAGGMVVARRSTRAMSPEMRRFPIRALEMEGIPCRRR
jgi:hypothetical protein